MIIDIISLLLLAFGFYKGFRKGFLVAVISLAAIIIGLLAAFKLSETVAGMIADKGGEGKWLPVASFLLVFFAFVIGINLIGKVLSKTADAVMLGLVNRLAGGLFYFIIYLLIISAVLFYAVQLGIVKPETTDASLLYPWLSRAAPFAIDGVGKLIPLFRDMFSKLDSYF